MLAACLADWLASCRDHPIAWTCVQRCTGYHPGPAPNRTPRRSGVTQPPPAGNLPQGASCRHGDPAGEVIRRPDGAPGGGPRQGSPGDGLHILLVEEPSDRRGLPRPGPPGPLRHRRQRPDAYPGDELVATPGAGGCRRTRNRRGVHGGAARRRRDPAVRAVRDRIGAEIHRRITSAIGPGADPGTVFALEMAFFGALVQAGSGTFTYHEIADRLGYVVGLILAGANEPSTGGSE